MDSASIVQLYRDAIAADNAWQAAMDAKGVYRYSPASTVGELAPLYERKLEAIYAYRAAVFAHASR